MRSLPSVAKSPKAEKIYCAPGNAGIAQLAECVPIGAMEFDRLTEFAKEKEIDLVIVGMDDPLVGGLVDQLEAAGIRAFGPRKNAAILEGSKAFSKELMKKYNIPTAAYEVFDKAEGCAGISAYQSEIPDRFKGGWPCTWKRCFNLQHVGRSGRRRMHDYDR